uniref:Uncharacterized protein n=1 Tax=Ditylenchus dipsaci TaxID=166011 RepID=A0A915E1K3_9BILA
MTDLRMGTHYDWLQRLDVLSRPFLLLLLAFFACLYVSNANGAVEQSDGTIMLKLPAGQDRVQARLLTETEDNITFTVLRPDKDDLQPEVASHKLSFSYVKDCIMSCHGLRKNFQLSKGNGRSSTADINSDAVVILSNSDEKSVIKGSYDGDPGQDKKIDRRCAVKNRVDSRFSPPFSVDFSMFRLANSSDFDATVIFSPAYKLYKEPILEPGTSHAQPLKANSSAELKLPIWAIVLISVGGVGEILLHRNGSLLHPLTKTSNRTSGNATSTVGERPGKKKIIDPKIGPVAVVVQPAPSHLQVRDSKVKTAISKTGASRLKSILLLRLHSHYRRYRICPRKWMRHSRGKQENRDAMQFQMQDKEFGERRDSKASRYESVGSLEANSTIEPGPSSQFSKPLE